MANFMQSNRILSAKEVIDQRRELFATRIEQKVSDMLQQKPMFEISRPYRIDHSIAYECVRKIFAKGYYAKIQQEEHRQHTDECKSGICKLPDPIISISISKQEYRKHLQIMMIEFISRWMYDDTLLFPVMGMNTDVCIDILEESNYECIVIEKENFNSEGQRFVNTFIKVMLPEKVEE